MFEAVYISLWGLPHKSFSLAVFVGMFSATSDENTVVFDSRCSFHHRPHLLEGISSGFGRTDDLSNFDQLKDS